MRTVGAAFGVGLAIVVVAVGGWQLGWWLKAEAVNKTTHIYEKSYGAQSAYLEQLQQGETEITRLDGQLADPAVVASEKAALRSQRSAVVNQECSVASRVTSQLPSTEASFVSQNC